MISVQKWTSLDVRLDIEQVYQLGSRVKVTGVYGPENVHILAPTQHADRIKQKIQEQGKLLPCLWAVS